MIFKLVAIWAGSVPAAGVLTLLSMPVWRWIEAEYSIEAVGHSGPAAWCYLTTYILLASVVSATVMVIKKKPRRTV